MESDISAIKIAENISRRMLLIFCSFIALMIFISISFRDRTTFLVETEQNVSVPVHHALAVPFIPFFIGEKSAVQRILTTEHRISKKTDEFYDAAEKHILSDLTEKIERSIQIEVKRRVDNSIRKSAVESIERNLAVALDDKDASTEVLARINSLDDRIQELESEIRTQVWNLCRKEFPQAHRRLDKVAADPIFGIQEVQFI